MAQERTLGHMDEERDTQVDLIAVKALSSCVQGSEVDQSMDIWGTDSVRSDH